MWFKMHFKKKKNCSREEQEVFCNILPLRNNDTEAIKQNHTLPSFFLWLVINTQQNHHHVPPIF